MPKARASENRGLDVVAALWGLAEATLFFIVPDVAISFAALHSRSRGLRSVWWATGGAVVGGAVMWWFGAHAPLDTFRIVELVPGISPAMIRSVVRQTQEMGLLAVLTGPLRGTPYKIYAAEWGRSGGALLPFLLATVPARAPRFLLISLVTTWVGGPTRRWVAPSPRRARWALSACWVLFYVGYLLAHPG
jgi:membrane protein YqaA with SNARE-associated domain